LCDIEEMNLKQRLKEAKRARITRGLRNAFVSLVLAAFSLSSQAQTTTCVVDQFDPSGTGGNSYVGGQIGNVWGNWFGDAFQSVVWDSASDASNNPASGSMKITANFGDQYEVYDGFNGINPSLFGLQYTNFQCDVRFDPSSATVMSGDVLIFGHLEFGTRKGNDQDYFGGVDIRASNTNWVHVNFTLNAMTDPNLMNIYDVLIHIYGPYYSPGLSGTSILWVDNIKFTGPGPVSTNCVVDWNEVHQRIDGFGASSAWASSFTTSQADLFFSTNNGIGLSLVRSRVAPDGTTETSIMQQAIARGARAWSTPWSPPAAYKDTNSVNGGNFVSTTSNLRNYASQLARYVVSQKTNRINLYAISIQNEPDFNTTGYESCVWTAQQIHDFIPYLHNALVASNVASTKIMIAESENWNFNLTTNAINDVTTSNLVGILAAHPYDFTVAPVNHYDKALWETEVSTLGGSFDGSITNGIYWAGQIHAFLTYAEVNAWHYWWLASAYNDNEGLTDNSGNPAKRMYVLGNYSRFVRPGYYRIGVSNNATTLISAYKDTNSGSFAIVAINSSSTTVTQIFNLTNFTASSVTPWITSGNLSLASQSAVGVTNSAFTYVLPALSVVTFVGQQQPGNTPPTLAPAANQTINAGVTLVVTNTATDTNQPTPTLAFSLLNAPNNATLTPLNNTNAVFTWRPLVSQANTTNPITVRVTNNVTSLSATNNFTVKVNPLAQPTVSSINVSGRQVSLVATGALGPDYTLLVSTNLANWQVLFTSNSPVMPVTLVDTNFNIHPVRFYRIQLGP
jgi:glucuronoarabinoxylan endo-1,4-beta-xylanase